MEQQMERWVSLARESSLAQGQSKMFTLEDLQLAVFRVEGGFRVTDNSCPHQGGPLSQGEVVGEVVKCPWHDWQYNLKTGCPVMTPPLKTYPVRVREGMIEVRVEDVSPSREEDMEDGEKAPLDALLEALQVAKTLKQVTEVLAEGLRTLVPHDRIGIALLEGETDKLIQVQTHSTRHILLGDGFSASIQGSSLKRLLEKGAVRILDDLKSIQARRPSLWTRLLIDEGMRSNLTLPLSVQGSPIGVLFFSSTKKSAFKERHVGMLKQIAGEIAISIEKGHWVSDLAQSNERYRLLFEMLHEGVFVCRSPDVAFDTFHPNLAGWLQSDVATLKARTLLSLIAPKAQQAFLEEVGQLESVGASRIFETTLLRRDHSPLPIELRLTLIEQQGQQSLMGFVRNLSEVKALNEQLSQKHSLGTIVGKSAAMLALYDLVKKVAPLPTTVLITGESGTGKELFARAIHAQSARHDKPMISVNCGALSESLLETEWFGHEKGAFTGAVNERRGRFELADGGTIFLDEIGELSPATQVKLLRVLQEGEFERVGSSLTRRIDVRVIAATHRDLQREVAQGRFREDLYYRLNVVQLRVPPLRARKDDIPLLLKTFISKLNPRTRKTIQRISEEALRLLLAFDYPGNVRQLENMLEHAFVLCQGAVIEAEHLPPELFAPKDDLVTEALHTENPLATLERKLIEKVLMLTDNNQQLAAQRLGISRTTLWRKLKTRP
ncbi:MAG: hypothetical protein CL920_04240 [Deltaproteobacteria bacterium]|nr:hypothetical protein [Deltaproteobacteria bacterium]MBU47886.1 hypothetical protein [Deltaproteobacteria bacterium]|tara:strand:- start:5024 stop:7192 length:2169 start_codon:yes stop_codon:yes gene_type:complete